jgi:hypothetical protein
MATAQRLPSGGQYQEAVQNPSRCFSDRELSAASFDRMAMGLPKLISGNFAAVFPMTATSGRRYAVKCFTREVPNQLQRYRLIGAHLNKLKPWWATDFQFIADGIEVGGQRYPILRMDWVSGLTLTAWISKNIYQPASMNRLYESFNELVFYLSSANMAHGDLQDGNLLIADSGKLHLVDYDGMYVPGLEGFPASELGHPDYQPLGRSQTDYGPTMDRFSAWLIAVSLGMLAAAPELWGQLNPGPDEYLLLNRSDLADLASSRRFAMLAAHSNSEVRRLAGIARDILPLPLASIPPLAVPSITSTPAAGMPGTGRIPDWMQSHTSRPAGSPRHSATPSSGSYAEANDGDPPARSLTWLVRTLAALPLLAIGSVIWNIHVGLGAIVTVSVLVMVTLLGLYRRDPAARLRAGLRRSRAQDVSKVKQAKRDIAKASKDSKDVEHAAQRLAAQHSKKQEGIKAASDRKLRQITHGQEAIDRQLATLSARKQREISKRLGRFQQEYVSAQLSRVVIDSNLVSGIGAQLVANLAAAGIRTAADFSGIGYTAGGGSPKVYFRLSSGRLAHVPGIGDVKAQRMEHWRQGHVANAIRRQPSALSGQELKAINGQFAMQERNLQDERIRVTRQIAAEVTTAQNELAVALDAMAKQCQVEQAPIDQRRTEVAGQLGRAHADRLAAEQLLLDWDGQLATIRRRTFISFVDAALRG